MKDNYKNSSIYIVSIIVLIHWFFIFSILVISGFSYINIVIFSFISSLILWLLGNNLLDIYLTRRIKNLYKLILKTKTDKREELFIQNILPPKPISEVETDVLEWTKSHVNEINFYKKLSEFKKDFLQNLSHEIRTPLFSIQAYCENLKINLENEIDKKQFDQYLTVILRNVGRLNNLIKDINVITKLENNQIILDVTNFKLNNLIAEVLEDFKFLIQKHNTIIEINFSNKITVNADREKIKQVINNLLDNAIKNNPNNIKISFNVADIDNENISFEITDNGKGIEEHHLNRIFERFYRADHNRSREFGGLGLGLSICKHIMKLHDSFIHVRSKVDVGTSFTIGLRKG